MLCSGYDADLILSAVKPLHGKVTVIPNTWSATRPLQSTMSRS